MFQERIFKVSFKKSNSLIHYFVLALTFKTKEIWSRLQTRLYKTRVVQREIQFLSENFLQCFFVAYKRARSLLNFARFSCFFSPHFSIFFHCFCWSRMLRFFPSQPADQPPSLGRMDTCFLHVFSRPKSRHKRSRGCWRLGRGELNTRHRGANRTPEHALFCLQSLFLGGFLMPGSLPRADQFYSPVA